MKITVKSNVYFNRLKRKKVPKLIFEEILKPLGRAALKKIKKATRDGVDIEGNAYADYTDSYLAWLKKNGFDGKSNNMILEGKLKKSIPMKIFTNEQANRVIIAPNRTSARNKSGDFYPAHHLYNNPNNREKGMRKWFFTDEELPNLLKDSNLLGLDYRESKRFFEKKLQETLKGKMRIIAGKTFEL